MLRKRARWEDRGKDDDEDEDEDSNEDSEKGSEEDKGADGNGYFSETSWAGQPSTRQQRSAGGRLPAEVGGAVPVASVGGDCRCLPNALRCLSPASAPLAAC